MGFFLLLVKGVTVLEALDRLKLCRSDTRLLGGLFVVVRAVVTPVNAEHLSERRPTRDLFVLV